MPSKQPAPPLARTPTSRDLHHSPSTMDLFEEDPASPGPSASGPSLQRLNPYKKDPQYNALCERTFREFVGGSAVVTQTPLRSLRNAIIYMTFFAAAISFYYSIGRRAYRGGAEKFTTLLEETFGITEGAQEFLKVLIAIGTIGGNFIMPSIHALTQPKGYFHTLDEMQGYTKSRDSKPWYKNPLDLLLFFLYAGIAMIAATRALGEVLDPDKDAEPLDIVIATFSVFLNSNLYYMSIASLHAFITSEIKYYKKPLPPQNIEQKIQAQFLSYLKQQQAVAHYTPKEKFDALTEARQSLHSEATLIQEVNEVNADPRERLEVLIKLRKKYNKAHADLEQLSRNVIINASSETDIKELLEKEKVRIMLSLFMMPQLKDLSPQDQERVAIIVAGKNPFLYHLLRYCITLVLLTSSLANGKNARGGVEELVGNPDSIAVDVIWFLAFFCILTLAAKFTLDAGRALLPTSLPKAGLRSNPALVWSVISAWLVMNCFSFGVSWDAAYRFVEEFINDRFSSASSTADIPNPDEGWGLAVIAWISGFSVINNDIVSFLGVIQFFLLLNTTFSYFAGNLASSEYVKQTEFMKNSVKRVEEMKPPASHSPTSTTQKTQLSRFPLCCHGIRNKDPDVEQALLAPHDTDPDNLAHIVDEIKRWFRQEPETTTTFLHESGLAPYFDIPTEHTPTSRLTIKYDGSNTSSSGVTSSASENTSFFANLHKVSPDDGEPTRRRGYGSLGAGPSSAASSS